MVASTRGSSGAIGAEGERAVERRVDGRVDGDRAVVGDVDHAREAAELGAPQVLVHAGADLARRLRVALGVLGVAEGVRELGGGDEPAVHRRAGERQDAAPLFPQIVRRRRQPGVRLAIRAP